MKELKLDLLPGNLYAAKKRAQQQKEQANVVKMVEVSWNAEKSNDKNEEK